VVCVCVLISGGRCLRAWQHSGTEQPFAASSFSRIGQKRPTYKANETYAQAGLEACGSGGSCTRASCRVLHPMLSRSFAGKVPQGHGTGRMRACSMCARALLAGASGLTAKEWMARHVGVPCEQWPYGISASRQMQPDGPLFAPTPSATSSPQGKTGPHGHGLAQQAPGSPTKAFMLNDSSREASPAKGGIGIQLTQNGDGSFVIENVPPGVRQCVLWCMWCMLCLDLCGVWGHASLSVATHALFVLYTSGGPAAQTGKMQAGDQLVAVDGIKLAARPMSFVAPLIVVHASLCVSLCCINSQHTSCTPPPRAQLALLRCTNA
jgi:hypothetical protein